MSHNRPQPPEDLGGESLLEWGRIVAELEAAGRLDATDRALLTVYVECWATYQQAVRGLTTWGPVVRYANGVPGASPFYKTARECAAQLAKLLAEMCLTPAARHRMKATTEAAPDGLPAF